METDELARQIAVEQVALLISQGLSKTKALEEVGISKWVYASYLAKNGNIKEFLEDRKKELEDDYLSIFEAKRKVVKALVKKANNEEISLEHALALESRLSILEAQLEKRIEWADKPLAEEEDDAKKFLKRLQGPNLRPGKAVITMTERTISVGEKEEEVIDL
jgi:hypothetical protein